MHQLGARYNILLLVVIHHSGVVQGRLSIDATLAGIGTRLSAGRQQLAPIVKTCV